jgi:signal transduction histidine kinase
MRPRTVRVCTAPAAVVVLATVVLGVATGSTANVLAGVLSLGALGVALVVVREQPTSAVGPALAWCAAAPLTVVLVEVLAQSAGGASPPPGASLAQAISVGIWPLNVAGLVALLLVFPDGRRPGWPWRAVPWLLLVATGATVFALWGSRQVGGEVVGAPEGPARLVAVVAGLALVATSVGLGVASVVRTYQRGDELRRLQVRWLALAGVVAAALLVAGWVAESLGAPLGLAYTPHLVAIVVLVPAAVGVAILRHDLFDVDRLLGDTVSAVVTALASAALFGAVVLVTSRAVGATGEVTTVTAAFVTALCLLPVHRWISAVVGRVVDHDRHVAVAGVERFAADVRAGRREPEEVEAVLRTAQRDEGLTLALLRVDGTWVDPQGAQVPEPDGVTVVSGGTEIARIHLDHDTARARRRVADLATAAWVPIEVSRLRLGLRGAVAEAEASRARLAEAVAEERVRLERDLHDGAQQQIVATGMRLRRLQRGLDPVRAAEVDTAVADLEETVRELRRLAHGVRPARLDDGLGPALEAVRAASPVPVGLVIGDLPPADETRTVTAYLVVSEAVANALKHACARRIDVEVGSSGDRITVEVRDDGVGGAPVDGPASLRDRVASVGGRLSVESVAGRGTTVRAVI